MRRLRRFQPVLVRVPAVPVDPADIDGGPFLFPVKPSDRVLDRAGRGGSWCSAALEIAWR